MKKIGLYIFVLVFLSDLCSQSALDREYIISQTNTARLYQLAEEHKMIQERFGNNKVTLVVSNPDGAEQHFSHFNSEGIPVYFSVENESSAKSSRIDQIRAGGNAGLSLNGNGITLGLWDGGMPRGSHQELVGRVNWANQASVSSHATHVAGILIASGVDSEAKGMAPLASLDAFSTTGWLAEIPIWAAEGGMVTNHSYILANPGEDYEKFGIYNIHAHNWDELSYNAPYLIMCTGASNNGNNGFNPDFSRYDLLASNKVGKNSIVVGACFDVPNYNSPSSVFQAAFTSWGPTDDWRIKPDITAVGVDSYSSDSDNNFDYDTGMGCSFASPVVAGGLALLQQHYHNINGVYMKSATAKALILSTADEAGPSDGPDFSNGWGLFNARRAADLITNDGNSSVISELTLDQGGVHEFTIEVDGSESLSIAICWNDPAADAVTDGFHNDPTPMLINDLDLRVKSGSITHFPWRMEPNSTYDNYEDPASKGDNHRDNIEIINVNDIEAGEYIINISHKSDLQSGSQDFSLIVNGVTSFLSSNNSLVTKKPSINIYPNPTSDLLNVRVEGMKNTQLELSIYNLTGTKQLSSSFDCQDDIHLNIVDLSKGIYFLRIQDENEGLISTKKIIVHY